MLIKFSNDIQENGGISWSTRKVALDVNSDLYNILKTLTEDRSISKEVLSGSSASKEAGFMETILDSIASNPKSAAALETAKGRNIERGKFANVINRHERYRLMVDDSEMGGYISGAKLSQSANNFKFLQIKTNDSEKSEVVNLIFDANDNIYSIQTNLDVDDIKNRISNSLTRVYNLAKKKIEAEVDAKKNRASYALKKKLKPHDIGEGGYSLPKFGIKSDEHYNQPDSKTMERLTETQFEEKDPYLQQKKKGGAMKVQPKSSRAKQKGGQDSDMSRSDAFVGFLKKYTPAISLVATGTGLLFTFAGAMIREMTQETSQVDLPDSDSTTPRPYSELLSKDLSEASIIKFDHDKFEKRLAKQPLPQQALLRLQKEFILLHVNLKLSKEKYESKMEELDALFNQFDFLHDPITNFLLPEGFQNPEDSGQNKPLNEYASVGLDVLSAIVKIIDGIKIDPEQSPSHSKADNSDVANDWPDPINTHFTLFRMASFLPKPYILAGVREEFDRLHAEALEDIEEIHSRVLEWASSSEHGGRSLPYKASVWLTNFKSALKNLVNSVRHGDQLSHAAKNIGPKLVEYSEEIQHQLESQSEKIETNLKEFTSVAKKVLGFDSPIKGMIPRKIFEQFGEQVILTAKESMYKLEKMGENIALSSIRDHLQNIDKVVKNEESVKVARTLNGGKMRTKYENDLEDAREKIYKEVFKRINNTFIINENEPVAEAEEVFYTEKHLTPQPRSNNGHSNLHKYTTAKNAKKSFGRGF